MSAAASRSSERGCRRACVVRVVAGSMIAELGISSSAQRRVDQAAASRQYDAVTRSSAAAAPTLHCSSAAPAALVGQSTHHCYFSVCGALSALAETHGSVSSRIAPPPRRLTTKRMGNRDRGPYSTRL